MRPGKVVTLTDVPYIFSSSLQEKLDFRDPLMVSLEFGLVEVNSGPVLDGSLPTSLNKTVIFRSSGGVFIRSSFYTMVLALAPDASMLVCITNDAL